MTLALCARSATVWVTGRCQPSEASAVEHGSERGGTNPGLQAAQDDMYEWGGRVMARVWMDYVVKFLQWERKKKREKKKSMSKQQ